jgi:hypothetical protein
MSGETMKIHRRGEENIVAGRKEWTISKGVYVKKAKPWRRTGRGGKVAAAVTVERSERRVKMEGLQGLKKGDGDQP